MILDYKSIVSKMWILELLIIFIKENALLFSLYIVNSGIVLITIINIMPIIFLISFSFLFSQKSRLTYLFILSLSVSLLFFVDVNYARAYGHLISFYMLAAKGVTDGLGPSVLSLIKWQDFLFFFDLPLLTFILIKSKNHTTVKRNIKFFCFTFTLSVIFIVFQFINIEGGKAGKAIGNSQFIPLVMSPIGYHMYDLNKFFYEKNENLDDQDIAKINNWITENEKYLVADQNYQSLKGILKDKNLIVIQVESLENIAIGQSYQGQEITPNINNLLKNSIYFNNIHEQVGDGNSSDAELLFNTSLYPIDRGSSFVRFADNKYVSLPILLKQQGYTSVAIHGDEKEFWNRDRAFKSLGFDKYISEEQFQFNETEGMGILDEDMFDQSILEIEKLKEPFNFFAITITSHMPFNLSENLRTLDLEGDENTVGYLQSIHYTDKVFGEFYNNLKEKGYLENSVIVIYGDHEGIHKYYSTELPDNNKEIPFIIHIPGIEGMLVETEGGQVDMMPTLAYMLGIDEDEYAYNVMGRNLFNMYGGSPILSSGEIVGAASNEIHLLEAQEIANIIIKGNYFGNLPEKSIVVSK